MFTFARAAGLAVALAAAPLAVSAATVNPASSLMDGGTYDVVAGPYFYDVALFKPDVGGSFSFTFQNTSAFAQAVAVSSATVLQQTVKFLGGVTGSWGAGEAASIAEGVSTGGFTIKSTIAPGASDTLTFTYGNPEDVVAGRPGRGNIDLAVDATVAPVPLPAGGLLLISALGGVAALRRRRKAA